MHHCSDVARLAMRIPPVLMLLPLFAALPHAAMAATPPADCRYDAGP